MHRKLLSVWQVMQALSKANHDVVKKRIGRKPCAKELVLHYVKYNLKIDLEKPP